MLSPETEALLREANEDALEPTEREYVLTCRVQIKEVSYADHQSTETKNATRKLVYLIPLQSTRAEKFLDAWLPQYAATADEDLNDPRSHFEVVMLFGHPFKQPARGAVFQPNHRCDKQHIYLMSLGVSQILIDQGWDGKEVPVTVLPASYDGPDGSVADNALEGSLNFDKKVYNKVPGFSS